MAAQGGPLPGPCWGRLRVGHSWPVPSPVGYGPCPVLCGSAHKCRAENGGPRTPVAAVSACTQGVLFARRFLEFICEPPVFLEPGVSHRVAGMGQGVGLSSDMLRGWDLVSQSVMSLFPTMPPSQAGAVGCSPCCQPALQAHVSPPLHILQAVAPEAAQLCCRGASVHPVAGGSPFPAPPPHSQKPQLEK